MHVARFLACVSQALTKMVGRLAILYYTDFIGVKIIRSIMSSHMPLEKKCIMIT